MIHRNLIQLLFITFYLSSSNFNFLNAIKCWDCRSDFDSKCADPFDNSSFPIKDCNQEGELSHIPGIKPTTCRKIRQKVNGEWRYIRGCAYFGEPGIDGDQRFCLMRTGSYNIFIEYCTCNYKDGCNSALSMNSLTITYALTLISTLLFFIFVNR